MTDVEILNKAAQIVRKSPVGNIKAAQSTIFYLEELAKEIAESEAFASVGKQIAEYKDRKIVEDLRRMANGH